MNETDQNGKKENNTPVGKVRKTHLWDPAQIKELEDIAAKEGISTSSAISRAIRFYLERYRETGNV